MPAHLVEPSPGQHLEDAPVNSLVKQCARRQQTDFLDCVAGQARPPGALELAQGPAREQGYFEGPNDFGYITHGDPPRSVGIQALEHAVQVGRSALLAAPAESLPQGFIAFGSIAQALEQGAQVKARS